jgi:type IV pilus assembly protein PilC
MNKMQFQYRAVDASGVTVVGVLTGDSRTDILRQVNSRGLIATSVRPLSTRLKDTGRRGVKGKDIAHFAQQLSVLMGARIPVSEALRSIADHEPNPKFKEILRTLSARVESGESISSSMEQHAEIFGDVFIETIKAAESSGNMTRVLEYLAEMLERSEETRLQVRSALMYPVVVVAVLSVAVLFLIGFVVPKFGKMFASRGVELPALTKVLLFAGDSLAAYWWAYLIASIVAGLGSHRYARSASGRVVIDRALHSIPVVRQLLIGAGVSRFARVFGLCLSSGLGLIEALRMAGRASGRTMLQADAERMVEQVRAGGRVSTVLDSCTYLPKFARRMIAAGEESAELPKMCSLVARQYDRETSVMAKNLATVIEPVLIIMIAAVVAVVALAVFMPMWDMVKLVA